MKVIIDRFEGDFAVVELENKNFVNISKQIFPAEAKEGDVIVVYVDHDETTKRKNNIAKLMNDVWKD